jgi:hypothetical protein
MNVSWICRMHVECCAENQFITPDGTNKLNAWKTQRMPARFEPPHGGFPQIMVVRFVCKQEGYHETFFKGHFGTGWRFRRAVGSGCRFAAADLR